MANGIGAALSALLLGACSVIGVRSGTEEPAFQVVDRRGAIEIRRYDARLAAETLVADAASEEEARGTGFRRLAGYIFGANRPAAKIAMTAPVELAGAAGRRIAMTAPVAQAPAPVAGEVAGDVAGGGAGEGWRIRFFMPAAWTPETLPEPTDPMVRIVTVPPATLAVARFAGRPTAAAVAAEQAALLDALRADIAWRAEGAVTAWFYDPPWTLPPLRRNEVAVPVVPRGAAPGR